jgi:nitrous oxide reductase accessory protein NosL
MKLFFAMIPVTGLACMLAGCDAPSADGPPEIRLGDSVCDECNMIISDQRWATATVVEGPRGPEPLLFDDFNCQVNHEVEHPELVVLARWSFSHATSEPVRTEDAMFLMSPNLRTPMGSKAAAFSSSSEAQAAQAELTGDVMAFDVAWKRFGFAGACCHTEEATSDSKEDTDGP